VAPNRGHWLLVRAVDPELRRDAYGAEVTVESLTSSAVSDVGPHYADVEEAIKKFNGRDVEGARKLLTEAKKKTPKLAPPEVMLFTLMANGGTMAQARGELEKAVQHYPNDPEAYLIMADIAVSENRLTEAGLLYAKASAVTEAFNENPKRKKTLQSRAYSGEGQVLEARENWQAAREKLALWLKLLGEGVLHHDRQRVGRAGAADGADRLRIPGQLSNGGVAGGMAIADLRQVTEDGAPEPGRQPPVQRQVESVAAAREVLLELPRGQVQAGRGMKDARADLVRESLEDSVVVLAGVGDADQALLSRGEQQRPDRAVDDPVGDIQDAVALGIGGQPVVQPTQVAGNCREGPR
jgi:tetratricopeptide (TPR) repeat protein